MQEEGEMKLEFRKKLERYCKRNFKLLLRSSAKDEDDIPIEHRKEGYKCVVRDMGYDLIAEYRVTEGDVKILDKFIEELR